MLAAGAQHLPACPQPTCLSLVPHMWTLAGPTDQGHLRAPSHLHGRLPDGMATGQLGRGLS